MPEVEAQEGGEEYAAIARFLREQFVLALASSSAPPGRGGEGV